MNSSDSSTSFSDMASATSLVPPDYFPFTDLNVLLSPILNIISSQWLRNFLFTNDPVHAQHLSSPGIYNSSFTCSLAASPGGLQAPQPDRSEFQGGKFFTAQLLFAPIFTVDKITVGVGVAEGLFALGDLWVPKNLLPSASHWVNFRFLKADHSRLLFLVYDNPEDDLLLFYYRRPSSSCAYNGFTGLFHRDLLSSINDGSISLETLRRTIIFCQKENSVRSCPICGAGPMENCGCSLPSLLPSHPFDGQYFSEEMGMHLGNFESVTNKILFTEGNRTERVVVGSRNSFVKVDDLSLVKRLSTWSVSEFMRKSVQLFSCNLNLSAYGLGVLDELKARSREKLRNRSDLSVSQDKNLPLISEDEEERTLTSLECDTADSKVGVDLDMNIRHDSEEVNTGLMNSTQLESLLGSLIKSEISSRKPDVAFSPSGKGYGGSEALDPKEMIRKIKAERRKERNRASARRSNQKRKERRLVISHEIDGLLERLESLREKELSLRKENLKLRKIVGEFC